MNFIDNSYSGGKKKKSVHIYSFCLFYFLGTPVSLVQTYACKPAESEAGVTVNCSWIVSSNVSKILHNPKKTTKKNPIIYQNLS